MVIEFSDFKSCAKEPPTKDGWYLVLSFYEGKLSYASDIEFTVQYGWNANAKSPGTRIDFGDKAHRDTGRNYLWTEVTIDREEDEE